MRRLVRCIALLALISAGLFLAVCVRIEGGRRLSPERLSTWWQRRLLRILNLRVHVTGQPCSGPRLLVCNHVSWLDIPVIGAFEATRFVSKAEVRSWPLAGWLATAAGTFYLKRGAGGTRELIAALAKQLPRDTVTVFPEGTTTEGDRVLRFAPRLFAAAIEAGAAVQPMALRYGRAADGTNIAPFVGEATLTSHLWRLLREPCLDVELVYCPALQAEPGGDRSALALAAHEAVCAAAVYGGERFARRQPESLAA